MADLIERLRAKAGLSVPGPAPHLAPGLVCHVYDAEMRALLTEAADALAPAVRTGRVEGDADPCDAFQDAMEREHGYRPQRFATGVLMNSRDADRYEGWQLAIAALSTPQPVDAVALLRDIAADTTWRSNDNSLWPRIQAAVRATDSLSAQGAAGAGEDR